MGAWIEIISYIGTKRREPSLLSWERGLKSSDMLVDAWFEYVAPLVGAWIEILTLFSVLVRGLVAPLVGAWIEMAIQVGL